MSSVLLAFSLRMLAFVQTLLSVMYDCIERSSLDVLSGRISQL